jgi:hypothetical protein
MVPLTTITSTVFDKPQLFIEQAGTTYAYMSDMLRLTSSMTSNLNLFNYIKVGSAAYTAFRVDGKGDLFLGNDMVSISHDGYIKTLGSSPLNLGSYAGQEVVVTGGIGLGTTVGHVALQGGSTAIATTNAGSVSLLGGTSTFATRMGGNVVLEGGKGPSTTKYGSVSLAVGKTSDSNRATLEMKGSDGSINLATQTNIASTSIGETSLNAATNMILTGGIVSLAAPASLNSYLKMNGEIVMHSDTHLDLSSGASGYAKLHTGEAGSLSLVTADSTNGVTGDVRIITGNSKFDASGDIELLAGGAATNVVTGGDILLRSGKGSTTPGSITLQVQNAAATAAASLSINGASRDVFIASSGAVSASADGRLDLSSGMNSNRAQAHFFSDGSMQLQSAGAATIVSSTTIKLSSTSGTTIAGSGAEVSALTTGSLTLTGGGIVSITTKQSVAPATSNGEGIYITPKKIATVSHTGAPVKIFGAEIAVVSGTGGDVYIDGGPANAGSVGDSGTRTGGDVYIRGGYGDASLGSGGGGGNVYIQGQADSGTAYGGNVVLSSGNRGASYVQLTSSTSLAKVTVGTADDNVVLSTVGAAAGAGSITAISQNNMLLNSKKAVLILGESASGSVAIQSAASTLTLSGAGDTTLQALGTTSDVFIESAQDEKIGGNNGLGIYMLGGTGTAPGYSGIVSVVGGRNTNAGGIGTAGSVVIQGGESEDTAGSVSIIGHLDGSTPAMTGGNIVIKTTKSFSDISITSKGSLVVDGELSSQFTASAGPATLSASGHLTAKVATVELSTSTGAFTIASAEKLFTSSTTTATITGGTGLKMATNAGPLTLSGYGSVSITSVAPYTDVQGIFINPQPVGAGETGPPVKIFGAEATGSGAGQGGHVYIEGGGSTAPVPSTGGVTRTGGSVYIRGGIGGTDTGGGGDIYLEGKSDISPGGNIILKSGTHNAASVSLLGAGTTASITVGTANDNIALSTSGAEAGAGSITANAQNNMVLQSLAGSVILKGSTAATVQATTGSVVLAAPTVI